ncbi:LysM peptidoglycan-binding domain-containing protein [Planctomycetota bacterium]|nr:LysM peptidoglycan-binding domain-containing protein [Planctomycetota bacterium]
MKYVWALGILATAAASVGCNTNPPQVAQVPPPPAIVSAPTDIIVPVQVEDPSAAANTGLQVPASQQVQFTEPAPQPTYTAPEPAPTRSRASSYIIKDGDNLWQIAIRVYGDGQKWTDIKAANPGLNENRLIPGKKINLP